MVLSVVASKLGVSAVSARTTACIFTGSDKMPTAGGLTTSTSRRLVLAATRPTGRAPRPKSAERQDGCCPVWSSGSARGGKRSDLKPRPRHSATFVPGFYCCGVLSASAVPAARPARPKPPDFKTCSC
jgi:hypothetical protein